MFVHVPVHYKTIQKYLHKIGGKHDWMDPLRTSQCHFPKPLCLQELFVILWYNIPLIFLYFYIKHIADILMAHIN